jgi:hypothetical protein
MIMAESLPLENRKSENSVTRFLSVTDAAYEKTLDLATGNRNDERYD